MKHFDYYLEAWVYCVHALIEPNRIQRLNWKTWTVNEDE